jgi:hypothetical protein
LPKGVTGVNIVAIAILYPDFAESAFYEVGGIGDKKKGRGCSTPRPE